jgi:hypothetical protein
LRREAKNAATKDERAPRIFASPIDLRVQIRRYVMQKTKALTFGLMLVAAAALLPQTASARPFGWHGGGWHGGWHGGGWHGGGWHGGWHHGGGWGWGAAGLGAGLAFGALAAAPYYGGYYAYPPYPYGYYPNYGYGYGYPGYYDYGYPDEGTTGRW